MRAESEAFAALIKNRILFRYILFWVIAKSIIILQMYDLNIYFCSKTAQAIA